MFTLKKLEQNSTMQDTIDSYINGNITYVRELLKNCAFTLGDLLDYFINYSGYCPSTDEIVMFVKRLES